MTARRGMDAPPVLSPEERRERNREEMRRVILEAARQVMREQGVAALSLREVARRVRMQAPSLYTYYPNKLALYDALFLEGIRTFATYWAPAIEGWHTVWDRLQAGIEAAMRFAREHPDLYQLTSERPVLGFVPSEASMAESYRLLGGLDHMLAEAIAKGEIKLDVSQTQARDLVLAMLHGLTAQHLANDLDAPVGSGRYGGLASVAVALFQSAWGPEHRAAGAELAAPDVAIESDVGKEA